MKIILSTEKKNDVKPGLKQKKKRKKDGELESGLLIMNLLKM